MGSGPRGEAKAQGQDARSGAEWLGLDRGSALGLGLRMVCTIIQGSRLGGGGGASLTMSLVLRAHPQGVCVAGYGQSGGNEILQLLPPPTLQVKETQVGVAAKVAPELSVFFGTVSSETGLGFRSSYLVSVALTRAWPGLEQLW